MTTHLPVPTMPVARGCPPSESSASIDPMIYGPEARRHQARAIAKALGAGWRCFRRALSRAASWTEQHILQPLARRSERRQAIAQLAALDARLLADIGLRRSDIELAVDGLLADPRVARRTPAPAALVTKRRFDTQRGDGSAASAGRTRPATSQQPGQTLDRAA